MEVKTFKELPATFCYKILPLVYDASLSYYELLCKVQYTVNEIIAYLDELGPGLDNVLAEFQELQTYVDEYFENLDIQTEINNKIDLMIENGSFRELLEQIALGYITPEMYGCIGDGTTDDSVNFTTAVAASIASGKPLHLHKNAYSLTTIGNIEMCSLYGEGADLYCGTASFTYGDQLVLSGIHFYNTNRYLKTEEPRSLFYSSTERERIRIENCEYTCTLADDTHRGKIFFRGFAEEITVQNVLLTGAYRCFVLSNSTQLDNIGYRFDNITAYNTETCIDIEGYKNANTFEGFMSNVQISNIYMCNTENEQINADSEPGRDCVILGNVNSFTVTNVVCVRAYERAVYCSICQNGVISNVSAHNCEGVKIAGTFFSSENIKKSFNVRLSEIQVVDGINKRALILYNARNIKVNGVSFTNTSGYGSHGVELTGVLDEIELKNISMTNCIRGCVVLFETTGWTNDMHNIVIDGVNGINPVDTLTGYYAVRNVGTGTIYINGLVVRNVIINEGQEYYTAGSFLLGGVHLEYAQNVKIDNIRAWGVGSTTTPQVDIAESCQLVYVEGDYMIVADVFPNILSSNGTYTMTAVRGRNIESIRFECMGGYRATPALPPHVVQYVGGTLQTGIAMQLINIRTGRVEIYTSIGHLIVTWTNGSYVITEQAGSVAVGGNVNYNPQTHTVTSASGAVDAIVKVTRVN